jgi:DNA-binding protein HU-beta
MDKKEQVTKLAEKTGFTKKDVETFMSAQEELILESVVAGDKVKLGNLGYFLAAYRAPRDGRNPQKPGEVVKIPETAAPAFRASETFKRAVGIPAVIAKLKASK